MLLCLLLHMLTENLALQQTAWQSNTFDFDTGADRAVDGRQRDLRLDGGQCAASDGGKTAEWRVDLGGVKNIHHVFLQYATGNRVWGILCLKVKSDIIDCC